MGSVHQLTRRQGEVIALLRRGDANKEIAATLGISEDSVKAHLSRLYLRFGVSNRVALLAAVERLEPDRALTRTADLGQLRSIAGRLQQTSSSVGPAVMPLAPFEALRQALSSVDAALDLMTDLPDDTKGVVLDAVRRRVETGLDALDELQRSLGVQPRSAATR